jgi:hypothetical protein
MSDLSVYRESCKKCHSENTKTFCMTIRKKINGGISQTFKYKIVCQNCRNILIEDNLDETK